MAVHDESAQAENPVDDLAEEYASVEVDVLGLVGAVLHAFVDFELVKQLALRLLDGAVELAPLDVAVDGVAVDDKDLFAEGQAYGERLALTALKHEVRSERPSCFIGEHVEDRVLVFRRVDAMEHLFCPFLELLPHLLAVDAEESVHPRLKQCLVQFVVCRPFRKHGVIRCFV